MARAKSKSPFSPQFQNQENNHRFDFRAASLSEMFFGFIDEDTDRFEEKFSNENLGFLDDDEYDDDDGNEIVEEDKTFWVNQEELLQATLCRTSSLESRIRNLTKESVKELQNLGTICACGKIISCCRSCLMREVSGRLGNSGLNSAICRSKWKSSQDIVSGEHTFIDVIDNTSSNKGEVRVIVELNFRGEFKMARGSDDYNRLVSRLPEVFVGKVERLNSVIKILCSGAKKCLKEKKMHMGPWRKHRYMQAKWLKTCERITPLMPLLSMGRSSQQRPKESLLTVDLLGMLPNNMHCTAVKVL